MKLISKTKLNNGKYEYYLAGSDSQGFYIQLINTASDDDKDVLILAEFSPKTYTEPFDIEGFQDFNRAESVATTLKVDFYSLTAKVYDQYGDLMEIQPTFEVEGTDKAKIKDGKLLTEEVTEDTSFFVVARVGGLEERQEMFLYAHREPEPSEIYILNKKIELLASENEAKDDLLQEIILQMYL